MGNTDRVAKLHTNPCAAWGTKARIGAPTWEVPILAQLGSLRLDDSVRAQVVAVLSAGARPVTLGRARLERQMRTSRRTTPRLASTTPTTSRGMARLREQLDAVEVQRAHDLPGPQALEWLDALAGYLADDRPSGGAVQRHPRHLRTDRGRRDRGSSSSGSRRPRTAWTGARAAEAVMARPTGVGRALATYEIPIEGRDEWLAAARRLA